MNGNAAQCGNTLRSYLSNDSGVRSHSGATMHYAYLDRKCLLHSATRYTIGMSSSNERLRHAREKKYETAAEAAKALGIPYGTYAGHENGHRGFPASRAPQYARKFNVSEEWLLYGKGDRDEPSPIPSEDQLASMLALAHEEIDARTSFADWPRAVAATLRAQLERFLSTGLMPGDPVGDTSSAPGKDAQSRAPTKPDARG